MGVEVELKAHVTDSEALARRLGEIGTHRRSYVKEDAYFGFDGGLDNARYRVRRDGDEWICTFKQKRIESGIEENRETEFTVSDGVAFQKLLTEIGLKPIIRKRKTGRAFAVDGVLAELSHVDHLGWYVELEIILPDGAEADRLLEARMKLQEVLHRLGIPEQSIESRTYNEMLYAIAPASGALPGASL